MELTRVENNEIVIAEETVGIEDMSFEQMEDTIRATKSRNGMMLTFDDFRMSLGGTEEDWGRKVFFKSMMDIGLIIECTNNNSKKNTKKCPTEAALEAKPEYFYYDADGDIWGLSVNGLDQFKEEVLPVLYARAAEVRELFAEEAELKKRASQIANRSGTTRLF